MSQRSKSKTGSVSKPTVKCIQPVPSDYAPWKDQYDIDFSLTKKRFNKIFRKKWVKLYTKKKSKLISYKCNVIKDADVCIKSFEERKTLRTIWNDKRHYELHNKDPKEFIPLTKFIYIIKNCKLSNGSYEQMMLLIGEKK